MTKTAGNYKKIEMFEKIKLKTANLRTKPTNFILWAMMFTVYTEPMSAIYILWTNPYLLEERVVCDLAHFFCLFFKFSFSEFNTEGIYFLIWSAKTCFIINQSSVSHRCNLPRIHFDYKMLSSFHLYVPFWCQCREYSYHP